MSTTATVDRKNDQNGQEAAQASTTEKASGEKTSGKTKTTKEVAALAVRGKASQGSQLAPLPNNRPVLHSQTHYLATSDLPGGRPIAVRSFEVAALLPGGSPIAARSFEVVGYLPGDRPIAATTLHYTQDSTLPGGRPVLASTLEYDKDNLLPGGRPVVTTNENPETNTLIGYLD